MVLNRIILIVGIILSIVFVSNYGGVISYGIFALMLSIPVCSFIYLIYVYARFRVYQLIDRKTIIKGEHIPYQFILANEDFITYTSVSVTFLHDTSEVENLQAIQRYSLTPGEQYNYNTTIQCKYRGEYLAGIDKVQVMDFLGLFQISYPSPSTINIKVLPRIVHLKDLNFFAESDAKQLCQNLTNTPKIPDIEVRNYVPTDAMKYIQWKATAREHKLLTKKFTEFKNKEIMLLMDTTKKVEGNELDRLIIEDKIIEATLAILDLYLRKGIPTTVLFDGNGLKKLHIHNKTEFTMFYNIVADLSFKSQLQMDALIRQANQQNDSQNFYIIVTASITQELCVASYQALHLGNEVIIICVNDNRQDEKLETLDSRIRVVHIAFDQEVREALEHASGSKV